VHQRAQRRRAASGSFNLKTFFGIELPVRVSRKKQQREVSFRNLPAQVAIPVAVFQLVDIERIIGSRDGEDAPLLLLFLFCVKQTHRSNSRLK
jgi:hypothetical protein